MVEHCGANCAFFGSQFSLMAILSSHRRDGHWRDWRSVGQFRRGKIFGRNRSTRWSEPFYSDPSDFRRGRWGRFGGGGSGGEELAGGRAASVEAAWGLREEELQRLVIAECRNFCTNEEQERIQQR